LAERRGLDPQATFKARLA